MYYETFNTPAEKNDNDDETRQKKCFYLLMVYDGAVVQCTYTT